MKPIDLLIVPAHGHCHLAGAHLVDDRPLGGGLGGGSSDAATVLVALNELWGLRWSIDELARLGLQLGADVPVFVRGHAAWALECVGGREARKALEEALQREMEPYVRQEVQMAIDSF